MMDGPEQNPMLDLFYGHFLSEGHTEGTISVYFSILLVLFVIILHSLFFFL